MPEAYILDAIRTPIGKRDGSLSDVRSDELFAILLRALVERTGLDPMLVEDVIVGCVTQTSEQGVNIARNAVLAAGWPQEIPGTSVNRLCGSGQQGVNFAAQAVMSGSCDLVIGGGTESMTRVAMGSDVGSFNPNLEERYALVPQGVSAEIVAEFAGATREEIDQFSFESHRRALHAIEEGRFEREIVVVHKQDKQGRVIESVSRDEGPRAGTSAAKIGQLKPAFKKDGVISAGSSSQISDGAALMLIGSKEMADKLGIKPRAKIVSMCAVGVNPTSMLTGPVPATHKVLEKAGMAIEDIDLFEVNEAFASVPLYWSKETGVSLDKVNVNGGAVALGHPLGASGCRLMVTLLHELERQELRYGISTLCIGMGQGIATLIERLD